VATLEEKIVQACGPVFPTNRLFFVEPDENIDSSAPYCVFTIVGGDSPGNTLTANGWSPYATARVQFSILSINAMDIPQKARELHLALEAANASRFIACEPLGPGFDIPSDETRLIGRIIEYSITSYDPRST
jgi:hypothetical protein